MSVRAGYDVVEVLFLEEATFGTTPTDSETWLPIWATIGFEPRPDIAYKEKIGVGRQIAADFVKTKEFAECIVEHELIAKEASPAFEWVDFYAAVMGALPAAATIALAKRLDFFSLGAKLDLATDEFWWLKGCKINEYELSGNPVENNPVLGRATILSQKATYGTSDYVTGLQTRQANPTTGYILPSDCDLKYKAASIYTRLNDWTYRISRDLQKRGSASADKKLYRSFEERKVEASLDITLDFDDKSELDDFLASTGFTVNLEVPTGSGGRSIDLTGGKWQTLGKPIRELDLIALTLNAKFTDVEITSIV